jgi:hypothetical protein
LQHCPQTYTSPHTSEEWLDKDRRRRKKSKREVDMGLENSKRHNRKCNKKDNKCRRYSGRREEKGRRGRGWRQQHVINTGKK